MWESKDIQPEQRWLWPRLRCGLMWESKDIQRKTNNSITAMVVVWCGNQKIYNRRQKATTMPTLWFDVGIKRYTTRADRATATDQLWFDVGIKRYTTQLLTMHQGIRCGLMWESKDIQQIFDRCQNFIVVVWCGNQKIYNCSSCYKPLQWLWFDVGIKRYTTFLWCLGVITSCGLMWESKDIQQLIIFPLRKKVVVWCGNQKIYNTPESYK